MSTFIHCQRHGTAVEWHSEPMRPTPPPDKVCPQCLDEARAEPLLQRTGSLPPPARLVSESPDDEYLRGVRNPVARAKLLELRDRQREEIQAQADAADELDLVRDAIIDFDHARPGPDRRKAHRRMLRAARGPRWIET